jgi:GNAT superfamily N-acetyltransferase
MIGERMAMPGLREISAVCTHPAAVGRGLARRLLAHASNEIFARGETPFLHVSPANTRAVQLYEQNHYRRRIDVPFWSLQRAKQLGEHARHLRQQVVVPGAVDVVHARTVPARARVVVGDRRVRQPRHARVHHIF